MLIADLNIIINDKTDDMDRISDLPAFIIHHIILYLDPKGDGKN